MFLLLLVFLLLWKGNCDSPQPQPVDSVQQEQTIDPTNPALEVGVNEESHAQLENLENNQVNSDEATKKVVEETQVGSKQGHHHNGARIIKHGSHTHTEAVPIS